MADYHKTVVETCPRLGPSEKDSLIAHMLLVPDIFNLALQKVPAELFDIREEKQYHLIWKTALELVQEFGRDIIFNDKAQAWSLIETKSQAKMHSKPDVYPPEMFDFVYSQAPEKPGLLYYIYKLLMPSDLNLAWGGKLLVRFLREKQVQDKIKDIVDNAGSDLITNYQKLLTDLRDADMAIDNLIDNPVVSGAPEGYVIPKLGKFPTGVDYLDYFLNGGHAPGETYGLLGPFGGGKTTVAVQLLWHGGVHQQTLALHAANEARKKDPTLPVYLPGDCYLFHYEAGSKEYMRRLWSLSGDIHRDTMEEFDPDSLSTRNTLKQYEIKLWARNINEAAFQGGERERLAAAQRIINRNMWLIDMSGEANASRGFGYVDEIAGIVANHQRLMNTQERELFQKSGGNPDLAPKHHVSVVVIDYAGLAAKKYLLKQGFPDTRLHHLLGSFGDECRRQIGDPFKTPVWIMHQLTGEANKRTHATQQHHADAAGSKSFAENLWFCFQLGTRDAATGVFQLTVTKARRTDLRKSPLLKFDPNFAKINQQTNLAIGSKGQIVEVNNRDKINPDAKTQPPPNDAVSGREIPPSNPLGGDMCR